MGGNLDDLLGALLGGPASRTPGQEPETEPANLDLGQLLGGLLGGPMHDQDEGTGALAAGSGISPALLQAALPLVLGALARGAGRIGSGEPSEADRGTAGLAARLQGDDPIDADYLQATGLPQQLAGQTGIDLAGAIAIIQRILQLLRGKSTPARRRTTRKTTRRASATTARRRTSTTRARTTRASTTARKRKPAAGTREDDAQAGETYDTEAISGITWLEKQPAPEISGAGCALASCAEARLRPELNSPSPDPAPHTGRRPGRHSR